MDKNQKNDKSKPQSPVSEKEYRRIWTVFFVCVGISCVLIFGGMIMMVAVFFPMAGLALFILGMVLLFAATFYLLLAGSQKIQRYR